MPVVVAHLRSVHFVRSARAIYFVRSVDDTVVESHHQRCRLEHRSGFQQVAHGVVLPFAVFAVGAFLHVHDGFHVACLHFHDDGHAHVAVDFLQFFNDSALGQVLHAHVDGRDDVGSVNGWPFGDAQVFVQHFLALHHAGLAAQGAVEVLLQTALGRVLCSVHFAHRSPCQ